MNKSLNQQKSPEILVVDDEADIRELVSGILQDEGFETRLARDSDTALAAIRSRRPQLIILDIWLQGSRLDGLSVLDEVKRDYPELPVIVISGHGTIETAVAAIKRGAYDFVEKPFKADRLLILVERALESARLKREIEELKSRSADEFDLIGRSSPILQLKNLIDKVAPTGSRVLVTGPAGSGKEVVARLLHERSRRSRNPFLAVNCAILEPDRLEVELFGNEGTDGTARKVGMLEQAHGGTVYLDEVTDMPLETQAKVMRVLVDQTFTRVGGNQRVQVDVRIVSSSSQDLREEIAAGNFREDLFHRMNVVPIRVPALLERRDDIPLLVEHFLTKFRRLYAIDDCEIGADAMAALQAHDWPGNVRQLRNTIERLAILMSGSGSTVVSSDMLPVEVCSATPAVTQGPAGENIIALPLREAREMFEREYLVAQINRFGGNISRTAAFVGMERSALHRKLKSLGVGSGRGSNETSH